ncbi:acyl-CoA dehydrogenase family protein [Acrocarpospora catenulata]|uniref:acyl-CoA dehydrogenase family protein n=1 Tax=Acrocarpospora catenulata TaxID=2836182 RepID=UPI001BDA2951|nr:acyl-CoA dehydrogenase family protein [Acrocarpospora catenulata]
MSVNILAGEVGVVAATALRELAARAVGVLPVAEYADGAPLPWSVVGDGGWDLVGVPGDGAASLRDLVEIAQTWGEFCVPLPLLPTILAKRWSAAARERTGPVTVSVAAPGRPPGRFLAPYLGEPEVVLALGLGAGEDRVAPPAVAARDGFAPTLRLAETDLRSAFSAEAAREQAVVWAAEAVGCARRTLRDSVGYARDRHQFDRPIGSFQAVKHRLARAHEQVELAESALLWAVAAPADTARPVRFAVDSSIGVLQTAIQVHGGMGFTWEMGIHFFLRHVLTLRELVRGVGL